MAPPAVHLWLDIDPESEPISGSLVYPDGRRQAFTGWIELTAALEEVRLVEGLDVVAHGEERAGDRRESPTSSEGRGAPESGGEPRPSREE